MRRLALAAVTVLLLTLTAARCDLGAADDALKAARSAVGKQSVAEVEQGGNALRNVGDDTLSAAQQQERRQLFITLDQQLDELMSRSVSAGVRRADTDIDASAPQIAQNSLLINPKEQFWSDLVEETAAQLKSAACDAVLSALAPVQRENATTNNPGQHNYAEEAILNLGRKYGTASVRQALAWHEWGNKVAKDGLQVAEAVEEDPQAYVQLFSKPPVQRGVYAYAKFCYALPGNR